MANNTQNTATDRAKILSGKGNTLLSPGATQIGAGAAITTKAVDLTNAREVGTVNVGDPGAASAAIGVLGNLAQSAQSNQANLLQALTQTAKPQTATTPTEQANQSTQDTAATPSKTKKILIGLALLAAAWWVWKKLF